MRAPGLRFSRPGAFGPDYPKPDVVYAASPDIPAPDKNEASHRPFETITPLCKRLNIKANKTSRSDRKLVLLVS
jgi:hypothetical protein